MVTPRPWRGRGGARDGNTATTARSIPGRPAIVRGRRDPLPALAFLRDSALLAVGKQLMALEDDLRRVQPSLALRPVKLDKQVLTVTAASAAAAARVRQFEPSLLAGLRARGWLVNRIRFRAQTSLMLAAPGGASGSQGVAPAVIKAPVGDRAIDAVDELRTWLQSDAATGDHESAFCAALADFVARQRGYRR
jgi:hypothetical protein